MIRPPTSPRCAGSRTSRDGSRRRSSSTTTWRLGSRTSTRPTTTRPKEAAEMKLKDRVVIVTGAAQGIGRAVAEKLDAEGATVVVADLNADGAEQAAGALERGQGMECDVSSQESVQAMVAKVLDEHGRVDALVNNAAIVPFIAWDDV